MPTYIALVSLTDQGMKNIKFTVKRTKVTLKSAEKYSIDTKAFYYTSGHCDMVWVFDAPDHETAEAMRLSMSDMGNSKIQILRCFSLDEMENILAKIS